MAIEQRPSVTAAIHLDTEGRETPCEVAITVWKEPVARNCNATANWVVLGIGCELWILGLRKYPVIFSWS